MMEISIGPVVSWRCDEGV